MPMTTTTIADNTAPSGGGLVSRRAPRARRAALEHGARRQRQARAAAVAGARARRGPRTSPTTQRAFTATEGRNGTDALGPLANNGGPTDTHALGSGSPAINAGDPSSAAAPTSGAAAGRRLRHRRVRVRRQPPAGAAPAARARRDGERLGARGIVHVRLPGSDEFFDLGTPAGAGRLDLRHRQGPRQPGRRGQQHRQDAARVVLPGRLQARRRPRAASRSPRSR